MPMTITTPTIAVSVSSERRAPHEPLWRETNVPNRPASNCAPAPASSARNRVAVVNTRPGTRTPSQPGAKL